MYHLALGPGSVPDPLSFNSVDTNSEAISNLLLHKKTFPQSQVNSSDEQIDKPCVLGLLFHFVLL